MFLSHGQQVSYNVNDKAYELLKLLEDHWFDF